MQVPVALVCSLRFYLLVTVCSLLIRHTHTGVDAANKVDQGCCNDDWYVMDCGERQQLIEFQKRIESLGVTAWMFRPTY